MKSYMADSSRTLLIQLKNEQALTLVKQLESLELITILEENVKDAKPKLSTKYRGKMPIEVFSGIQTDQILKQIDGY